MPIILEDIDLTTDQDAKAVDVTFFDDKFTGNGRRKSGLLGPALSPVSDIAGSVYSADSNPSIDTKATTTQNGFSVKAIPIAPITRRALSQADGTFTLPLADQAHEVATDSADWSLFFGLTPQGAQLYEDSTTGKNKRAREFVIQYRMELVIARNGTSLPNRLPLADNVVSVGALDSAVFCRWSTSPVTDGADFVAEHLTALGAKATDLDALLTWMNDEYIVHDSILAQAQVWDSADIAEEVAAYIAGVPADPSNDNLNALALQLRYLENYVVPLESYSIIHKALEARFNEAVSLTMAKQNLNLLMSHTLDQISAIKDELAAPGPIVDPNYAPSAKFSPQQLACVTSNDPLNEVVAGAGTGKSTTLIGRIQYLEACGIAPSDITVLSFTNIAADNIKDKYPGVGSMTIARMIHDIYSLNHPLHEISSIDTIVNSLDIFYPNRETASRLRHYLIEVNGNKPGSMAALNTFVEMNYDAVMEIFDEIRQTSLEIEIIVCYQRIDEMTEPNHTQCKHLIIDEVQDNSIFEFIYVLKSIAKHKRSLFIVGDASQTLFEFRSANPRALNALEGSGVFQTFQLTTNYRSNQEILDFANVSLADLETNQLAKIRLQANSLDAPTAESFNQKVTVDYHETGKVSEFVKESLPGVLSMTVCPNWVDERVARGEQVAFLAHNRREVGIFEQVLAERYPTKHVANLTSDKRQSTDIFSKYIKNFWNDVLVVRPDQASFTVAKGIKDNLGKLTRNGDMKNVKKAISYMIEKWWVENHQTIRAWEVQCAQGHLPHKAFFERLRDNILSFEIRNNAARQAVVDQRNRDRKEKNAQAKPDLVVSTVHGAKGMEFDHVVVVHQMKAPMKEADKRLFYVAFTRAMVSEYVLSYGNLRQPTIVSSHEQIVAALTERDRQTRARELGITMDELEAVEEAEAKEKELATSA